METTNSFPLNKIKYPYLPKDSNIEYVDDNNRFMMEATKLAQKSTCTKLKIGAVIVKNNEIIASGSNTGDIEIKVCPREVRGYKTGTGYELCKSTCHQKGHAEVMAIQNGEDRGLDMVNAGLYLAGHWWCCKTCWDAMLKAGIKHVFLSESSKQMAPK